MKSQQSALSSDAGIYMVPGLHEAKRLNSSLQLANCLWRDRILTHNMDEGSSTVYKVYICRPPLKRLASSAILNETSQVAIIGAERSHIKSLDYEKQI